MQHACPVLGFRASGRASQASEHKLHKLLRLYRDCMEERGHTFMTGPAGKDRLGRRSFELHHIVPTSVLRTVLPLVLEQTGTPATSQVQPVNFVSFLPHCTLRRSL